MCYNIFIFANKHFSGLAKMRSTEEEVTVLQQQLQEMKPALEIAAKDADEMIKIIAADTVRATILFDFPIKGSLF